MKNIKRIGLVGVIVLAGSLLLTSCHQGNDKAGTVDMMQLMQSPVIKTLSQSMMTQDQASQTELKSAYETMQQTSAEAQKAKGAAKKNAEKEAESAKTKFTGLMNSFQQTQKAQQEQLKNDISSAIATVAKAQDLSHVYIKQVVLYGNDQDITQDVLNELKKSQK
jgi:Skp family chaperone for outer membrane proteins